MCSSILPGARALWVVSKTLGSTWVDTHARSNAESILIDFGGGWSMFQSGCCSLAIISEVGWSAGTVLQWPLRVIDDLKRLYLPLFLSSTFSHSPPVLAAAVSSSQDFPLSFFSSRLQSGTKEWREAHFLQVSRIGLIEYWSRMMPWLKVAPMPAIQSSRPWCPPPSALLSASGTFSELSREVEPKGVN